MPAVVIVRRAALAEVWERERRGRVGGGRVVVEKLGFVLCGGGLLTWPKSPFSGPHRASRAAPFGPPRGRRAGMTSPGPPGRVRRAGTPGEPAQRPDRPGRDPLRACRQPPPAEAGAAVLTGPRKRLLLLQGLPAPRPHPGGRPGPLRGHGRLPTPRTAARAENPPARAARPLGARFGRLRTPE